MEELVPDPRPSGRRIPMPHTYAVKETCQNAQIDRVDRRALLRAADHAGRALRLPCSARSLLGVLAAAYGEQHLSQGLMVWPSNLYLECKTGLPERTLRNAIVRLRQEGVVVMVDSPNGKRFARRQGNAVVHAFGFNLTPLFVRREEFASRVAEAEAQAALCRTLRHDLSAARKDLEDIVAEFRELGRHDLAAPFAKVLVETAAPRSKFVSADQLEALLVQAVAAKEQAEKAFYKASYKDEYTGSAGQNGRHKESNTDFSIENCKENRSGEKSPQHSLSRAASGGLWASERKQGEAVRENEQTAEDGSEDWRVPKVEPAKIDHRALLDVGLWREACPALSDFGPVHKIDDVARVGATVARLLQVAPHGLARWQKQLGPALFPLVAAYVYQVYADDQVKARPEIRKPGGFFCYVAKEVSEGIRDLAFDVMALRRRKMRRSAAFSQIGE